VTTSDPDLAWWRRRLRLGRWQVYFEPRDLWIGVYVAWRAVYIVLVPTLVVRYARKGRTL
jgi:hypothetical protein